MDKRLLIYRLVLLTLFLIGFGMIAGGIWGVSNANRIDKEYISATAKIENIKKYRERRHGKNRTRHDVIVSYMVNGKVYTGNLNAYSSFMQVGDSIPLKYNPHQVTEIRSVEIEHIIFVVMIIAGVIVLISDLFMPRLFRKLKFIH